MSQNKSVADEATASCDVQTDAMVQRVIRRVFRDCTVLTVAHRIHTIADSDRILVLSEGKVVEFDAPATLLQTAGSHYRALVEESNMHRTTSSPRTPRAS